MGHGERVPTDRLRFRFAYALGALIERVEGTKHFVPEDRPEEITAAVNELLKQTSTRSRLKRRVSGSPTAAIRYEVNYSKNRCRKPRSQTRTSRRQTSE